MLAQGSAEVGIHGLELPLHLHRVSPHGASSGRCQAGCVSRQEASSVLPNSLGSQAALIPLGRVCSGQPPADTLVLPDGFSSWLEPPRPLPQRRGSRRHSQALGWLQPHHTGPCLLQAPPRAGMEPSQAPRAHCRASAISCSPSGLPGSFPMHFVMSPELFQQEEMPAAHRTHRSQPSPSRSGSIPGSLRSLQLELRVVPVHSLDYFLQGQLNNLCHGE